MYRRIKVRKVFRLTIVLAISELMEHGFVSWETFSTTFIHKVVTFVNMNLMDSEITQLSLAILESVVQSDTNHGELVRWEVTVDRLLVLLQLTNKEMQTKVMALFIALMQKVADKEREEMLEYTWKKNMHQFIHKHIIHEWSILGDEMSQYLYVLQCLSLDLPLSPMGGFQKHSAAPTWPKESYKNEALMNPKHSYS
uniref:ELMO armadillo-like helical domain-containing protein n=1 Tax=Xenopus tropicalis TaxID=8364 RepID=A0A6I8R4V2_XENTR